MANSQIDFAMQSDISDITHTAAGTVSNGVRVVVAEGASVNDTVTTLQSRISAIVSDSIGLE